VEGGVAQHQANLLRLGGEDLLDEGIEAAACLARRVEEFDDFDLGVDGTEHRRVIAHQCRSVLLGELSGLFGFVRGVEIGTSAEGQQQDDGSGDEQGFLHLGTL